MPRAGIIKGKHGRVQLDGTNINAEEYSFDGEAEDIPAMGFEDVNADGTLYDDGDTGIVGATITFKGYWDGLNNPHANPPNIKPGAILANVKLYVNKITNRFFSFPEVRCLRVGVRAAIKGRVDINFSGKTNGKITYPV